MEKNDARYRQFLAETLTYTGEVAAALGLVPDKVRLDLGDREFLCGIHSASFTEATLLLRLPASVWSWVSKADSEASLTLGFQSGEDAVALSLFRLRGHWSVVKTHVTNDQWALVVVLFEFSRVPPDRFVELQGGYLESRKKATRRCETRLKLTAPTMAALGIRSLTSAIWVDNTEHLCVLRELSLGGSQLVMSGQPDTLQGKEVSYGIPLSSYQDLRLRALVVRADCAVGQTGFVVLGLKHEQNSVTQPFLDLLAMAEENSNLAQHLEESDQLFLGGHDETAFGV